jgi:hypothetical protein
MADSWSGNAGHIALDLRALRVTWMAAILLIASVRASEAQYSALKICRAP